MKSGVGTTVPLTPFVSASAEGSLAPAEGSLSDINNQNVFILWSRLPCAYKAGVQEEDEASDNKEDDSSSED